MENKVNKKRKKRFNFKRFLFIYSMVLIAVAVVTLVVLFVFLNDYEKSMPVNEMKTIVNQVKSGKLDKLMNKSDIQFTEFETEDSFKDDVKELAKDNEITYSKKLGEYSAQNPVYVVKAGDTAICKVALKTKKKGGFFNEWQLDNVKFGSFSDDNELKINVPSGSKLYINDVEVSDSYRTETAVNFEPCLNVSKYVKAPTNDVYTITGLNVEPEVKVVFKDKELQTSKDKNTITAYYPEDESIKDTASKLGLEVLECYGKYIINRGSLDTLSGYMVGKARSYVENIPAVWAFLVGKKFTYEFRDEQTSNLRVYSSDCFSIDVSCNLYVDWTDGNKTYETAYTFTFVKVKDKWKVADLEVK